MSRPGFVLMWIFIHVILQAVNQIILIRIDVSLAMQLQPLVLNISPVIIAAVALSKTNWWRKK